MSNTTKNILDEDWAKTMTCLAFGTVGLMNQKYSHQHAQKVMFLNEEIDSPVFNYEHIRRPKFVELKEKYEIFLESIRNDTVHDSIVRSLYEERIAEKLVELELVLLITTPRSELSDDEFATQFKYYNQTLFGYIDNTLFNDVLLEMQLRLRAVVKKRSYLEGKVERFLYTYTKNAKSAQLPRVYFGQSRINSSLPPLKNAEAIKEEFDCALKQDGLDEEWQTIIDVTGRRKTISVGYITKQIYIPNDTHYTNLGKQNALGARVLQKLIAHEVHAHVRRQSTGAQSSLHLLGLGLAHSRQAEEGVATFCEQQLDGANDYFAGYLSYFAIGLAQGLDREEGPRSFKEVFLILKDFFKLLYDDQELVANHLAWDRCIRIYRGTRARTPGLVLHKDLLYRTGNIAIHALLTKKPATKAWLFEGRFDPGNESHTKALMSLGLIKSL